MSKCSICHKNEAVVFTTRIEDGESRMQGICLKCAYEAELPGIEQLLSRAGINQDNIDEITAQMNEVLADISAQSPEDLLKALLSGEMSGMMPFTGADAGLFSQNADRSDGEDENEDAPDSRESRPTLRPHASIGELMPANVGGESDDIAGFRKIAREKKKAKGKRERRLKFLEQFAINLTEEAASGRIDRIIGRDEELARTIQILNRRTKNNPALIGEAGVGKSAIAEGLAVRIVEGNVPAKLLGQELYLLDMTAMVAGTQFRGQFESRMKGVVEDARRAGNVILVIDELHNIMGAGDAEGAMNAANILKPALARGEIKVIGSTTLDEYRRFIEKDSALERRFQKVIIEEPSAEDTLEILIGVKDYYEKHHHVIFPTPVLETAVRLSDRYIMDRYQPDKSIDLIDEAGSRQNLDSSCLTELKELHDRRIELEEWQNDNEKEIAELTSKDDALPLYETQANIRSELMRILDEIAEVEKYCQPVVMTTGRPLAFFMKSFAMSIARRTPGQKPDEDATEMRKSPLFAKGHNIDLPQEKFFIFDIVFSRIFTSRQCVHTPHHVMCHHGLFVGVQLFPILQSQQNAVGENETWSSEEPVCRVNAYGNDRDVSPNRVMN
jgi:ATP-dependent Clp protease ATP-binding subunit ClpC